MKTEVINKKRNTIYTILSIIGIIFLMTITIGSGLGATGGNITTYENSTIHTYYNNGTFTTITTLTNVTMLIVAGGGGGGGGTGGGGGAGGIIYYNNNYTITPGTYTIIIGAGGIRGMTSTSSGQSGQNTSFDTLIAVGGGGGGLGENDSYAGGSSGGAGWGRTSPNTSIIGQGNKGGNGASGPPYYSAGGGGGSSTAGNPGIAGLYTVGTGGNGTCYTFTNVSTCYAGGGGGGAYDITTQLASIGGTGGGTQGGAGINAVANSGSGGGGAKNGDNGGATNGNGGSGIIILKYVQGAPDYNVSLSKLPIDINTSLIGNVNFTASITIVSNGNITNNSNVTLFYRMNTSLNGGCAKFENQLCTDNVWKNKSMIKVNNTLFTSNVRELDVFPGYYAYNQEWLDNQNITYNYSLYLNNNIKFIVQNFSTYTNPFLSMEFDGNNISSASVMSIYYCNSSYTTGVPSSNINCELVQTIIPTGLTNYHMHGNHRHYVLPIAISTVTKTQNSSFIFYSTQTIANGWRMEYMLNSSYNNRSFQIGSETAWSSTPYIFDLHLHQFLINDSFNSYATFNDGLGFSSISSVITDFLEAINQPPTTPKIFKPVGSEKITLSYNSNTSIIFQWTQPRDFENDLLTYSLYLTNGLSNFYVFTNLTNSSFSNNTYNANISRNDVIPTVYSSRLSVCDNNSNCVTGSGNIILCSNDYYNVTAACVSGAAHQTVIDLNGCDTLLDFPTLWNNTYVTCTVPPTEIKTVYNDDMLVLIILGFFLVLAIVLAITVHEGFFGLSALIVALMMATFLYYDYPDILVYFAVFMIILLSTMWIIIARKR